jgi:hypothetical protein
MDITIETSFCFIKYSVRNSHFIRTPNPEPRTLNSEQPAASSQQPAVGSRQSAKIVKPQTKPRTLNSEQPATSNQQPALSNFELPPERLTQFSRAGQTSNSASPCLKQKSTELLISSAF